MRVVLTELARSYHSRTLSTFPPQLLPFGLQRFMQGRRLLVSLGLKPVRFVALRVVLWAFRELPDGEWIPIWYRLPLESDQERVPLCKSCFGDSFALGCHEFYGVGKEWISGLVQAHPNSPRSRSKIASIRNEAPEQLNYLTTDRPDLLIWHSESREIAFGRHSHQYQYAALIEDDSIRRRDAFPLVEAMADSRLKNTLDRSLRYATDACQDILRGETEDPALIEYARAVTVDLEVRASTNRASEPPVNSGAAPRAVSELVDRVINSCRSGDNHKAAPLDTLFISRCGEPRGSREETAYAKFLLGERQREALRLELDKRSAELSASLVRAAKLYLDQKVRPEVLVRALDSLGLVPYSASIGSGDNPFHESRWRSRDPQLLPNKMLQVLDSASFPARSVISNRIMGHGCCEEVHRLYESSGLTSTLEGYPIELLLTETVLLPEASRECLFYVPLPIPNVAASGTFDHFFRSYAVGMASPSQVQPETLREILDWASPTLYGALLLDAYRGLVGLARQADSVRTCIRTAPDHLYRNFGQLLEQEASLLSSVIRLADFHIPGVVEMKAPTPLGALRAVIAKKGLEHGPVAEELQRVAGHIIESALTAWREQHIILMATDIHISHGGLIDELAELQAKFEQKSARGESASPSMLRDTSERLQEIQNRYRLVSDRANGRFSPPAAGLNTDQVQTLYNRAIVAVVNRHVQRGGDVRLRSWAPHLLRMEEGTRIFEEPAALYQLLYELVANIVKHEVQVAKTIPMLDGRWVVFRKGVSSEDAESLLLKTDDMNSEYPADPADRAPWGITAAWISEDVVERTLHPTVSAAYRNWGQNLKHPKGAVLLTANPFTGKPDDFMKALVDADIHRGKSHGLRIIQYITSAYFGKSGSSGGGGVPMAPPIAAIGLGSVTVLVPGCGG